MLIFFSRGKLGNQMFQYAFLRTIQKDNEVIVATDFDEFLEAFDIKARLFNISSKYRIFRAIVRRIISKLEPILSFLSNRNIISSIKVDYEYFGEYKRESDSFTKTKGIFFFVSYIHIGFFQSEKFFDKEIIDRSFIVKDYFKSTADSFIQKIPQNCYKVFVHIRRSDYEKHTAFGKNVLLPVEYYQKLIQSFFKNKKNVFFIFMGDDTKYVKYNFGKIANSVISENNHPATDLQIASLCQGGILSPSSFSWWGAYLMKERDVVFAPKYWLGFNSKIEYQKGSVPSFAIPVDVPEVDL